MSGAKIRRKDGAGRVDEIQVRSVGDPPKPATPPSLTQYMGQRYTHTERLSNAAGQIDARAIQFNEIHSDEKDLFLLAVADCGGLGRRRVRFTDPCVTA